MTERKKIDILSRYVIFFIQTFYKNELYKYIGTCENSSMWFRSEVPSGQDLFTVASRSAEGKDVKTGQMQSDFSCLCFLLVFGNLKSIPWGPFGNVFNNTWWFFLDIYLVTFRTRRRLRPAHQSLALGATRQIGVVRKKYLLAFLLIVSLKPFILCLKSQRLSFCHILMPSMTL